jgi:hypothetical protein
VQLAGQLPLQPLGVHVVPEEIVILAEAVLSKRMDAKFVTVTLNVYEFPITALD